MLLRIVDSTASSPFRDVPIREGELFLLPANTPHNPIRFADTVGIVLEQPRPKDSVDTLRWYCQDCREVVHEASFHCTDLGSQIKDAVNKFVASEELRKCKGCGVLCDTVPRGVVQP
jgi:3-hydroxyanthranilate 3,4-dioxygenase